MPNRLIDETSPYLLQHANNPVEWYPWGAEALTKAKAEDKPIFLSIGYAACHWCHVMAHESFEDEATAKLMNELYVNIKVDREERPDLDSIYMSAVVGMTGSGGWPMSMFLTPDGKPFYGGTYFPPSARYGMPGFQEVLQAVSAAWKSKREEIVENSQGIVGYMQQAGDFIEKAESSPLSIDTLTKAAHNIEHNFDRTRGGWGGAPKFPQPMTLEFLIRSYAHANPPQANPPGGLEPPGGSEGSDRMLIDLTLTAMARGGMYDQLGGGFHRYSTDANWLVPHFEKMLYDNSQLARVYLHAYQTFGGTSFYKRITTEILDYVAREMTHPDGGFYSTQDADSEGAEGKFFVWSVEETRSILGDEALLFNEVYGVTPRGNFHDDHSGLSGNVLSVARNPIEVAKSNGLSLDELETKLAHARQKLFEAREQRVKPNRDEKILSGWNGLMLAAFAEAARDRSFDRSDQYRSIAEKNAAFLLRSMRTPEGRLYRSWKDGQAKLNGYLEDYASVIEGLLALYQTTFNEEWFVAALELADEMIKHFADAAGGFFDTSDDHETLVTRPKDLQDNATPSGNALASTVLLKLHLYTMEEIYYKQAELMLGLLQPAMIQAPTGFAQWLCALDFALSKPFEIAIVGDSQSADAQALIDVARSGYRSNQVIAVGAPDRSSAIPLLLDRPQIDHQATAYVCQNFACQRPTVEPSVLSEQLS
jgi:hypothetical protein